MTSRVGCRLCGTLRARGDVHQMCRIPHSQSQTEHVCAHVSVTSVAVKINVHPVVYFPMQKREKMESSTSSVT